MDNNDNIDNNNNMDNNINDNDIIQYIISMDTYTYIYVIDNRCIYYYYYNDNDLTLYH